MTAIFEMEKNSINSYTLRVVSEPFFKTRQRNVERQEQISKPLSMTQQGHPIFESNGDNAALAFHDSGQAHRYPYLK
jgi:hypothetical protein